ncbi:MAG: helix-hairpin-helix domain-containing protein [Akkermansiaceae bacterium]
MRLVQLLAFLLLAPSLFGSELTQIPNCRLIPTDWADGDSFSVRLPDGREQTIRLYGADCIEMHVQGDDSNARRLRDQRRHFGIDNILVAKSMGEAAKAATFKKLTGPFTIHTTFADGRGDGRFSRVYAFVVTADGEDLTEWLVSQGLARAFGVVRQRPDGTRGSEWREQLADLELTAARAASGAWAKTDWKQLPEFRKQARDELAELEVAKGNKVADESTQIDPNTAARDELMSIPGVGEKTADAIIEARPYQNIEDLLKVAGIGPASLKKIEPFLKIATPGS